MTTIESTTARKGAAQIERPPSMVQLAAQSLRRMIIGGDLLPGDRVVENQLTKELGISRPPLREALRVLEREGLIKQVSHKGAIVTPLTLHDVYEIVTLRRVLERMAIDLALPVTDGARLARCRSALEAMELAATDDDPAALPEAAFAFHLSVIGLSGHDRLEDTYRSLYLQMLLCMVLNRRARAQRAETPAQDVQRHRRLLELIEAGDPAPVLAELERHGDRTFIADVADSLEDGSPQARAWLDRLRAEGTDEGTDERAERE
ncbi:GntR family transcriptional regulator [Nocardiopsis sediminis]|uniref:GntR family transcriptional regulator n=1 Tax=Nocardiopsis sediminis TaxID=1778267 RepID=A0ABV8FWR9_9ACTN